MPIKFLTDIVDRHNRSFSTTPLYDMFEAIQPLCTTSGYGGEIQDRIYLVPRDGFDTTAPRDHYPLVVIPETIKTIPANAFNNLCATTDPFTVVIPKSVTKIEGAPFSISEDWCTQIIYCGDKTEWCKIDFAESATYYKVSDEINTDYPYTFTLWGKQTNDV